MTTNDEQNVPMQRWTVHVPAAHKIWRTVDRRHLDGFSRSGQLYLTCTLPEAQAIARQVVATRLQGGGWPTRTVGKGKDQRTIPALEFSTCDYCSWTGEFRWGPCINGAPPQFGGRCFQCEGKGYQDEADQRRNYGYINHAIRKAFNCA